MARFEGILSKTFKAEGGYQNISSDSGNWYNGKLLGTNMGITGATLQTWWNNTGKKAQVTANDVKALTKDEAEHIYRSLFWNRIQGDSLENTSVAELIFSIYIGNPANMLTLVKKALAQMGVLATVSLPFSNQLISKINAVNQRSFFNILWQLKREYLDSLKAKYPQFYDGWIRRHNTHTFESENQNPVFMATTLLVGAFFAYKYRNQIQNKLHQITSKIKT